MPMQADRDGRLSVPQWIMVLDAVELACGDRWETVVGLYRKRTNWVQSFAQWLLTMAEEYPDDLFWQNLACVVKERI